MNFIEKLFGFSPDNGSGATEILWLAALATVLVIGIAVVRRRKQSRITIEAKKR